MDIKSHKTLELEGILIVILVQCPYFAGGKTEAWRQEGIFPRPHTEFIAGLGLEYKPSDSQFSILYPTSHRSWDFSLGTLSSDGKPLPFNFSGTMPSQCGGLCAVHGGQLINYQVLRLPPVDITFGSVTCRSSSVEKNTKHKKQGIPNQAVSSPTLCCTCCAHSWLCLQWQLPENLNFSNSGKLR